MDELNKLIEDNISLDKKIEELDGKIYNDFINFTEIEQKKKDILIDVEKLIQLHEKIVLLFDDVYKKSKSEKDIETLAKLKDVVSRIKNV